MSAPIIDEAAKVFADPTSYADEPRLHAALTHLRAQAPVSLVDSRPYRPFWAITKHSDIMHIERPTICSSTSRARCWPPLPPTTWRASNWTPEWGCAR